MPQSSQKLIRLLEVELPSGSFLRYQNYQLEPYVYRSESYEFLGFSIDSDPQKTIDLDNAPSSITIANDPAVRNVVEANDGLRRAVVTITSLFLDNPNSIPVVTRTQVLKANYSGAAIGFQMESPVNAVVGRFPQVHFVGDQWRELPKSGQASFR
jgi:hypothetical protein